MSSWQIELDELESVSILTMTLAWGDFSFSTFEDSCHLLEVSLNQVPRMPSFYFLGFLFDLCTVLRVIVAIMIYYYIRLLGVYGRGSNILCSCTIYFYIWRLHYTVHHITIYFSLTFSYLSALFALYWSWWFSFWAFEDMIGACGFWWSMFWPQFFFRTPLSLLDSVSILRTVLEALTDDGRKQIMK